MQNAVEYSKFRHFVGIAETFAWINIGWLIVGFAPLIPFIAAEFDLPIGTVMIGVMAIEGIAGAASAMLWGPLVDKIGPRKVLFISAVLSTIFAVLIPFVSKTFTQLVILRVLQGLAAHGPIFASKAALAQRWFPRKEQGTWIGIWNAAFAIGTMTLYKTFFPLMVYFGSLADNPVRWLPTPEPGGEWRLVAAFLAVPSALFAITMGIALFGKEPVVARHGNPELIKKDFAVALKLPTLWAAAILLGCAQVIMQTTNGLTASYLMKGLKWFPQVAGPSMTFIQGGMIVSGFLMGAMLTYIFRGNIKWLAATLGYLVAGFVAVTLVSSFAVSGTTQMRICFFSLGFFMNIGYPAVTTFVAANFPPHTLGKVFGICGGVSVLIGATGSGIAGALLDKTHTYTSVYVFIMSVGILACIIAATMLNPVKAFAGRQAGGPPAEGSGAGAPVPAAAGVGAPK